MYRAVIHDTEHETLNKVLIYCDSFILQRIQNHVKVDSEACVCIAAYSCSSMMDWQSICCHRWHKSQSTAESIMVTGLQQNMQLSSFSSSLLISLNMSIKLISVSRSGESLSSNLVTDSGFKFTTTSSHHLTLAGPCHFPSHERP